jgi:predicted RNase H-like HicB family nuclease
MNLAVNPTLNQASETIVTFVLEPQASGHFVASVLEFPRCRAEADSREAAIVSAQQQLREYLEQVELVRITVPSEAQSGDAWDRMFGAFKGDPDFAEIAAEIRALREMDDDSEVNPAVYES